MTKKKVSYTSILCEEPKQKDFAGDQSPFYGGQGEGGTPPGALKEPKEDQAMAPKGSDETEAPTDPHGQAGNPTKKDQRERGSAKR